MRDSQDATCETCRFGELIDDVDEGDIVVCRRHAPKPEIDIKSTVWRQEATWPMVQTYWWCGEWQAKITPPGDSLKRLDPA